MNRQDLLTACENIVVDQKLAPHEAAKLVLNDAWLSLDDALKKDLAIDGLGGRLNSKLARNRKQYDPAPPLRPTNMGRINRATANMTKRVGRAIKDHAEQVLKSISLHINGRARSLFEFDASAIDAWATTAASRSTSWAARATWCVEAREALRASKVKTLGELPVKARNEIASSAERVWAKAPRGKRGARAAA